jgi:hypothetical protein
MWQLCYFSTSEEEENSEESSDDEEVSKDNQFINLKIEELQMKEK